MASVAVVASASEDDDLALDQVTPAEERLRDDVDAFRRNALKAARRIIHFDMPTKLFQLDAIVRSLESWTAADIARMGAYVGPAPPLAEARPSKRQRTEEDADEALAAPPPVVYTQTATSNKYVVELANTIKNELVGLIDMCNKVKIAIQLSIPRIEDGNNFGVSIQEETVAELGRAEDSAFVMLESISKYYIGRAKLSTKTIKYPHVEDYQRALQQLDEKELANLRLCAVDLRNNVAILFDVITKNLDRIKKPRSSNTASMY